MAIPWYPSELEPRMNSPLEPRLSFFSTEDNNLIHHHNINIDSNSQAKNKNFLSMNSVRNIITKSNSLFKLPERDIDKISSISGEDGSNHRSEGSGCDDYTGHDFNHTGLIHRAFLPMRLALMAVGRFPLPMRMIPVTTRDKRQIYSSSATDYYNKYPSNSKHHLVMPTRVKNYEDTLVSPLWIYFGLTTLFLIFVLVMSTMAFFDVFMEWKLLPGNHQQLGQKTFMNNLVVFLVVWGCLVHSTLSSVSLFINRKKMVKILNFWNVAADELLITQVRSQRRFLIASNVGFMLFLVLLYFAYSKWQVRLIRDAATLFGVLAIRPFYYIKEDEEAQPDEGIEMTDVEEVTKPDLLEVEGCGPLPIFGIVTIIYAIYASRAFLFIFSFKCRLLRSLFRVWNARLVQFLRKPDDNINEKQETNESLDKIECYRLLSDMSILLKMVKQMDKMFATVLQAYYGVQLINMCFELYILAKSGTEEFSRNSDDVKRSLDIVTAALTLCQNVYFFFTVSLDGAYVGEEADKGHDALRRYPVTPQSSIQKKYLVYNLSLVYNKRITLTGGKFFTIDRPFIITVLGAVITYFVIIMQIQPSLNDQYKPDERIPVAGSG